MPEVAPEKGAGKALLGGDCYNLASDVIHGCVAKQIEVGEEREMIKKKCTGIYYLEVIPLGNIKYKIYEDWYMCLKRAYETKKECDDYCHRTCAFMYVTSCLS